MNYGSAQTNKLFHMGQAAWRSYPCSFRLAVKSLLYISIAHFGLTRGENSPGQPYTLPRLPAKKLYNHPNKKPATAPSTSPSIVPITTSPKVREA